MDFRFDVCGLFGQGICLLDNRMTPVCIESASSDVLERSSVRSGNDAVQKDRMCEVIDKMGEASAKAQSLHSPITSAQRFLCSDHHLFVMLDRRLNPDAGSVVGILKVGRKTLFVYDRHNVLREMYPLCILDFYIHESRQRTGLGRKLFDCMLKTEDVRPEHLAIDRPSHKFSSFLHKHYKLRSVLPQVNNFVVFEGFFSNRTDNGAKKGEAFSRPPTYPNKGRPYSHYDRSDTSPARQTIPTALVDLGDAYNGITLQGPRSRENLVKAFVQADDKRNLSDRLQQEVKESLPSNRACAAEATMYSRHVPCIATPNNDMSGAPLRPRDGPSHDYQRFLSQINTHQTIQDRRGHLVTSQAANGPYGNDIGASEITQPINIVRNARSANQMPAHASSLPAGQSASWTVFGPQPNYHARKWQHTKLW